MLSRVVSTISCFESFPAFKHAAINTDSCDPLNGVYVSVELQLTYRVFCDYLQHRC